ncbi:MAG: gamma carbonic anhydrase family protein [Proteobacteria bacterium]|nr:gamma carbonic anhydrase family protein [Pseudomonadota bacterium]MBU4469059.1 gamma carbonic anhydrase family protein [Pseudomonadota bacterium]MCG2751031.1 gamma carbonic anhydrase family protein [Desulfobacteraceae bacterium]
MIRSFNGKTPKIHETAFISETAYVVGDVTIGKNSGIWPGAVVRADFGPIVIGENTMVEDNSVVHSGNSMDIGSNIIIGHGVVVHGRKIGDNTLIGNNATILDDAEIGDNCIVGAGSLVRQGMKIPDSSFVVGIPAEIKKQNSTKTSEYFKAGISVYQDLMKQYKAEGL